MNFGPNVYVFHGTLTDLQRQALMQWERLSWWQRLIWRVRLWWERVNR